MRDSHERLRPASPTASPDGPGFGPKLPWKGIAVGLAVATVLGGAYFVQDRRKAETLRATVVARLEESLTPAVGKVTSFRETVEGWTLAAVAEAAPTETRDPRLDLDALHLGEGAYVRIRASEVKDAATLAAAAKRMAPDAITRCLGISPASMKGFYEQSAFLAPAWLTAAKAEASTAKLKILEQDLALRVSRDLPGVMRTTRSQYFLLAVERGPNRREHPVDFYLWDMKSKQRLLAKRTKSTGGFVTVKVGPGRSVGQAAADSPGAHDCSIASQLKDAPAAAPGTAGGSTAPTDSTASAADATPPAR